MTKTLLLITYLTASVFSIASLADSKVSCPQPRLSFELDSDNKKFFKTHSSNFIYCDAQIEGKIIDRYEFVFGVDPSSDKIVFSRIGHGRGELRNDNSFFAELGFDTKTDKMISKAYLTRKEKGIAINFSFNHILPIANEFKVYDPKICRHNPVEAEILIDNLDSSSFKINKIEGESFTNYSCTLHFRQYLIDAYFL